MDITRPPACVTHVGCVTHRCGFPVSESGQYISPEVSRCVSVLGFSFSGKPLKQATRQRTFTFLRVSTEDFERSGCVGRFARFSRHFFRFRPCFLFLCGGVSEAFRHFCGRRRFFRWVFPSFFRNEPVVSSFLRALPFLSPGFLRFFRIPSFSPRVFLHFVLFREPSSRPETSPSR